MNCPHCQSSHTVKNGRSYHGRQRYRCLDCQVSFGSGRLQKLPQSLKDQAIALYLEGNGFRAIERLLKVSNVAVLKWVRQAAGQQVLQSVKPEEIRYMECDEVCSYVSKKKTFAGSGGLLIVLPGESADGRWAVVTPKQPGVLWRSFQKPPISSTAPTTTTPTR